MNDSESEQLNPEAIAEEKCRFGQAAFEQGRYREAIEQLEAVQSLVTRNSRLGGVSGMWLATAYQALGKQSEAISLCKALSQHPRLETRKQARRLLEVLEAPVLSSDLEGRIKIPDFSQLDESQNQGYGANSPTSPRLSSSRSSPPTMTTPTEVERNGPQENQFLWIALIVAIGTLAGLSLIL
ncbi:MAG: hypothetical protein ACFBSC_04865 [Microcoleaceae cyanobacterium]